MVHNVLPDESKPNSRKYVEMEFVNQVAEMCSMDINDNSATIRMKHKAH